jgi:hypothetical protein
MSFDRDALLQRIDRLVAGTITAEEHRHLEAVLKAHPEARKTYFAYVDLDMGLRDIEMGRSAEIPPPVGATRRPSAAPAADRRRPKSRLFAYVLVAAVASVVTALPLLVHLRDRGEARPSSAGLPSEQVPAPRPAVMEHVATLLFADDCRWEGAAVPLVEGQRLSEGELHLAEGLALVRFDGGAVAVLSGPVRLELESRGSVRLHQGRVTVRAPEEAVGFTVRTPAGEVMDLGTEFAVEVDRSGGTELHVVDGEVEYRKPEERPGSGRLLKSGEAVRFDEATAPPRRVTFNAKPLDDLLSEAGPRVREDLLVVYEGFQYPVGRMAPAAAGGGWGWSGPWRLRRDEEASPREPDTATDMHIAYQKLNVPWPIRGGRAGMLEMPPGANYRVRPLAKPVDMAADAVYYVSLMMREEAAGAASAGSAIEESARLTFRSSRDYWGDRISFALPGGRRPHIEVADFIRFTGPPVSERQSLLWVAKIIAQSAGEDEIFFRTYEEGESLDIVEPADWSIASRGVRSDAALDLVLLTSTGDTRRWFDELRIGTSWRAVVPITRRTRIGKER